MTISVIIPTHNRLLDLKKAIQSIINQSVLPGELIVVDDASDLPMPITIFENVPSEIQYILLRNEMCRGGNYTRNRGIMEASADWIAFLDDDDEFKHNKIEVIANNIMQNFQIDLFYHPAEIHMLNEGIKYISNVKPFTNDEDIFRSMLITNKIGGTSMAIVRKQALIDVGLFDEQMPAAQDYELWLKMAKAEKKIKFIDQPLTNYYHVTKKTAISKSIEAYIEAIEIIENKYKGDYDLLNTNELKRHKAEIDKGIIHRYILNGQVFLAFKYQIKQFFINPNPKYLVFAFAILLGPKILFRIKAMTTKGRK